MAFFNFSTFLLLPLFVIASFAQYYNKFNSNSNNDQNDFYPPFMWGPYDSNFRSFAPFWTFANEMDQYRRFSSANFDRSGGTPVTFPCYANTQWLPEFKRRQRFGENNRCNGLYKCSNGRDESNCPRKCHGPLYSKDMFERDCRDLRPRYQYNAESRECEFFTYGGCVEKINMFIKKSECERECAHLIHAPDDDRVRLATDYEEESSSAPSFYGILVDKDARLAAGEVGKPKAEKEIDALDIAAAATKPTVAAGTIPCKLNETGPDAHFYNETDRCNGFYDCPDGEDERKCMSKCLGFRYAKSANILDCRASIPRWYYDFESQKCVFFHYGGCAAVPNMFLMEVECQSECAGIFVNRSVASLPPEEEDDGTATFEPTTVLTTPAAETITSAESNDVVPSAPVVNKLLDEDEDDDDESTTTSATTLVEADDTTTAAKITASTSTAEPSSEEEEEANTTKAHQMARS